MASPAELVHPDDYTNPGPERQEHELEILRLGSRSQTAFARRQAPGKGSHVNPQGPTLPDGISRATGREEV